MRFRRASGLAFGLAAWAAANLCWAAEQSPLPWQESGQYGRAPSVLGKDAAERSRATRTVVSAPRNPSPTPAVRETKRSPSSEPTSHSAQEPEYRIHPDWQKRLDLENQPAEGLVDVVVAFQQDFGSSLRLHVGWDDLKKPLLLRTGESHTFRLQPGGHLLHLRALTGSSPTAGTIEVALDETAAPHQIVVTGTPRFEGADLNVAFLSKNKRYAEKTIHSPVR